MIDPDWRMKLMTLASGLVMGLLLYAISGCGSAPPKTAEQVKEDTEAAAIKNLPADAKNVTHLGKNWYTFELNGQKFLYKWWYGSHSEVGHTVTRIDK